MSRHIGKLREEFEQGSVPITGFTFQDDIAVKRTEWRVARTEAGRPVTA